MPSSTKLSPGSRSGQRSPDPLRGAVAGLVGGLVASLAMDLFQGGLQKLSPPSDDQDDKEPATEQAADKVCGAVTGEPVAEGRKSIAGQAVHYGFGAALGAAYGIIAEYWPKATTGEGTAFGLVSATLFDEIGVPLAGLGDPPWKASATSHLNAYASHAVFGASTEAVRKLVRAAV